MRSCPARTKLLTILKILEALDHPFSSSRRSVHDVSIHRFTSRGEATNVFTHAKIGEAVGMSPSPALGKLQFRSGLVLGLEDLSSRGRKRGANVSLVALLCRSAAPPGERLALASGLIVDVVDVRVGRLRSCRA